MTENRITLVTLGVTDLDRSRRYYEAIGWTAETVLEAVVFFAMDGAKFGLFRLDNLAREQGRDPAELGRGAATLAQNFNAREDVDAAWRRAVEAGATGLVRPVETAWGGYSGYVADPDGHVWEYAMNPFWPLDERGRLA